MRLLSATQLCLLFFWAFFMFHPPLATLLVLAGDEIDAARFGELSTRVQSRLPEEIDLLAFHPTRLDSGPFCSPDSEDAAHYTVRSPFATLQLLRRSDLTSARAEFAARHPASRLPGVLLL